MRVSLFQFLALPFVTDLFVTTRAQEQSVVTVKTSLGDIRGIVSDGIGVDSFLGIQYAVVGERYTTSTLVEEPPEDGVINATQYGPVCWQDWPFPLNMAEECLYLNVWRPSNKNTTTTTSSSGEPTSPSLATLVFIHGGAFVVGSGQDFTGMVLASKYNLIVVTINYRLGPLGSLVTDETGTGGMNSVLDAINALTWVQQHIASFGGDPNRITVAGMSAGAMMTSILSVSTLSQGLFQQVILQSGVSTLGIRPRNPEEGWELTRSVLDSYGVESVTELTNRSRFPPSEILNWGNGSILKPWPQWNLLYLTLDGHVLSQPPQDLYTAAAAGGAHDASIIQPVNMMLSTTSYDGLVPMFFDPNQVSIAGFQQLLVENFGFEQGMKLYQEYDPTLPPFGGNNDGNQYNHSAFAAFTMLNSDLTWTCPTRELAATAAQALHHKGGNVYLYNFAHHSPYDMAWQTWPFLDVNMTGWASHGMDQAFLEGQSFMANGTTWTANLDAKISQHFLFYAVSFIQTGDPNSFLLADEDGGGGDNTTTNVTEWLPVAPPPPIGARDTAVDVNTMVFTPSGGSESYSYLLQQSDNNTTNLQQQRKTELCSLLLPFICNESWRYHPHPHHNQSVNNSEAVVGEEEEEGLEEDEAIGEEKEEEEEEEEWLEEEDNVTTVSESASKGGNTEEDKEEASSATSAAAGGSSLQLVGKMNLLLLLVVRIGGSIVTVAAPAALEAMMMF